MLLYNTIANKYLLLCHVLLSIQNYLKYYSTKFPKISKLEQLNLFKNIFFILINILKKITIM